MAARLWARARKKGRDSTAVAAHTAGAATKPLEMPRPILGLPSLHDLELVHPPAAVFVDIDIALGVHRNAMRLVELTGLLADAAEARQHFAGLAIDDVDLRIVLVDDEHVGLLGIGREIDRHRGAAELLDLAVGRHGDGLPRQLDGPLEVALLVVDLDARIIAVADIDEAVIADRHAMHIRHTLRFPL